MYTFYKSNNYNEGVSIPFAKYHLKNSWGNRKISYFFGHLITFNVSLMHKLPLSQHLNELDNFLDTMYDTALQYPFFELSGKLHSKFVNEINYLYSTNYGANDDSNIFKILRRYILHLYVTLKQPLK
jgi:hypothetical protein